MKIAFLGQGPFANPIKQKLHKTFGLVSVEDAEVVVVASWGKILTKAEIEKPKYGTLNIHPSCLPKYRGATPVQWAIINGDKESGLTIIQMDGKMDHGPMLVQKKIAITNEETSESLTNKLAELGAQMIVALLPQYVKGKVKLIEQDDNQATYVYRFKKEDGLLDLDDPVQMNERKVRALWPWPGTWIEITDQGRHLERSEGSRPKKLLIHQAHVENGKLIPDVVQLEGRKIMSFDQFKRGWNGPLHEF